MSSERLISSDVLSALTGVAEDICTQAVGGFDAPTYRFLDEEETHRTVREIDRVLRDDDLRRVGEDDPAVWEDGWDEIFRKLSAQPASLDTLRPQYYRDNTVCRLNGRFAASVSSDFEYAGNIAFRRCVFESYLAQATTIVEFGCGTGLNLLMLAERFPGVRLIGSDWARPTEHIAWRIAEDKGADLTWRWFNMLTADGWRGEEIDSSTAILTVHAMEQLGGDWRPFLEMLLALKPGLCLHVEPLVELYDASDPFDGLAIQYHGKRNYLSGFVPHIQELAAQNLVEIVDLRRVRFGGLHHDANSILAWKPV